MEKCPCQTDPQSCCACVSMHCHECHKDFSDHNKFIQGRFCSNCGRPLKGDVDWHREAELNAQYIIELEAKNKQLQIDIDAMRSAANSYKMHYNNLAKEIFADIKKAIFNMEYNVGTSRKTIKVEELKEQVDWVLHKVIPNRITEIENKYTEGMVKTND